MREASRDLDPAWPSRDLGDISPTPFWLDSPAAPAAQPPLTGSVSCDLAVVGAGYTGLWTALLAKERDSALDVVVEGGRSGWQASGRNGGFCMASLTHGHGNNLSRWPDDLERLTRAGIQSLTEMRADIARHGIDCDWLDSGALVVATEPWQVDGLKEEAELAARAGVDHEYVDGDAIRGEIDSPSFLASDWDHAAAICDPARLAWGLARVCLEKGVRIFEGTPATALRRAGGRFGGDAGGDGVVLDITGQGVATRFGANVCLDLLAGEQTERTALPIVGSKPVPWPPEPLRSGAIALTQRSMQRAQDNDGARDLWLRSLDRFNLGFDT